MKILLWIAGAGVAFVALLAVIGSFAPSDPNEQIEQGCKREFGHRGEAAVLECRARLTIEYLQKSEADRLNRARR